MANASLHARVMAWHATLAPREQRIVAIGAVVAAVLVVGGGFLRLHALVHRTEARLESKRADLAYIQGVLPELRAAPQPQAAGESLVSIIDRTSRESGLAGTLRGTEPAGAAAMRVRFEGAAFDDVLGWVLRLEREYGLTVQAATVERTDVPGRVNASLTLAPG